MNISFRSAIFISTLIHSLAIIPFHRSVAPIRDIEQKKPIVIDYVVIKEPEKAKSAEKAVELKEEVDLKPPLQMIQETVKSTETAKDSPQDLAKKQAELRSTKDHINYYQLIREKIRRRLKDNYKDYSSEGEVYFVFTLSSDGALVGYDVDYQKSTRDKMLIDIVVTSLSEASPFPAFPKGLSVPTMPFSLIVSFKKR